MPILEDIPGIQWKFLSARHKTIKVWEVGVWEANVPGSCHLQCLWMGHGEALRPFQIHCTTETLEKNIQNDHSQRYGSVRPTKSQILVFLFASTRPQMSAGPRQIHVPGSSSRSHHPFPRGSLRPHGVDGSCRDAQPQAQRSGTEWNCRWRSAKGHIQCWWLWKAQDKPRVARYDCWCKKNDPFNFIIVDSP